MPVKCVFLYFWHWFKKQCNYIELNTEIWTCKNEYNLKSILNNLLTPEVLIMKKCEYKTILQGISQFLWPLRNRIQFITVLIYSCLLSCWLVYNVFLLHLQVWLLRNYLIIGAIFESDSNKCVFISIDFFVYWPEATLPKTS